MTTHSIWGSSTPPGTFWLYNDGTPSIKVGHAFYTYGNGTVSQGFCVGAKVWFPSDLNLANGQTTFPETVRLSAWSYNYVGGVGQLDGTPLQTKTVPFVGGGWIEVLWDEPFEMPGDSLGVTIGVDFPDRPTAYLFGADGKSSGPAVSLDGTKVAWAEANVVAGGTTDGNAYNGIVLKLGTSPTTAPTNGSTSYGIDILVATELETPPAPTETFGATVAEENLLAGLSRPNWFDGVGSEALPAFSRSTYFLPGETAEFSIDYNQAFTVDILRLGHYGGSGARLIKAGITGTPTAQPAATVIPDSNGAVTCAAWSVNASWAVPADALPGWYYALLQGANGTDFGHVLFSVSDKNAKKPVVIVTGDATWHAAYNGYGNNNVYGASKSIGSTSGRALCSTYDKPVITKDYVPQTHFFNASYPYLKYSESLGLDAGVTTIEQITNDPTILDGRSLVIWTGHNEYVSQQVMDKTVALLAAGQKMMNVAGNDFFWRVKFTDGAFDSASNGRVMWCKKDTMAGPGAHVAGVPFTTEADWTGTWQDTRWSLRQPSAELFGDQFVANGIRSDQVKVPASMQTLPAWRNCPGIQALTPGQEYAFVAGSLGMEWDKAVSGGPTQVPFSASTVVLNGVAADANGEKYNLSETATHEFTMGLTSGGGLIANFNSDQWPWALDAFHLRGSAPADVNARQMMLNVLTDFGAQANPTSVSSASLILPTAISDVEQAYELVEIPPEPEPVVYGTWYSNGESWIRI